METTRKNAVGNCCNEQILTEKEKQEEVEPGSFLLKQQKMFSKLSGGKPVSTSQYQKSDNDWSVRQLESLQKKRELDALKKTYEERKQMLVTLDQQMKELQTDTEQVRKLRMRCEKSLKDERLPDLLEKVKQEVKETPEIQAEAERLKKEIDDLTERKKKLQSQLQKCLPYKDFMERVCKLTKFEDVDKLTGYCERLLDFRDKLSQRENQRQEHLEQQKKVLLTLKDQHNLMLLQKNNELCQLHKELEKTRSEGLLWESKWNHIQETAARKTLELGQIKFAILNIYETICDKMGVEAVDKYDTEKQLEQIKMFMLDHKDILKQCQMYVQSQTDGTNKKTPKQITKTN